MYIIHQNRLNYCVEVLLQNTYIFYLVDKNWALKALNNAHNSLIIIVVLHPQAGTGAV